MNSNHSSHTARELLASAHLFASSLTELLEEKLVSEVSRRSLSFSHIQALQLLNTTQHNTVTDIATFLGVSNAAASKAVDRLVRGKWLHRSRAATDRRSTLLSLTGAGRRVLADYDAARLRELHNLFRELSPAELKQTSRLLYSLSIRMCDQASSPDEACSGCEVYFRERCLLRASSTRPCTHNRKSAPRRTPQRTAVLNAPKQIHSPTLLAAEVR